MKQVITASRYHGILQTVKSCSAQRYGHDGYESMTHAGSCSSKRKNASLLFCGGSLGHSPAQVARSPVAPTSVRMHVITTVAMEVPTTRSLSVLDAKVRIQKPEIQKSLVTMATGRIYIAVSQAMLTSNNPMLQ